MKKIIAAICFLTFVLGSCSISDTAEPPTAMDSIPSSTVSPTAIIGDATDTGELTPQVSLITRDLGNLLSIDAEVTAYSGGKAVVYTTLPSVYTPAFLSGVFFADDGSAQTITPYADDPNGFMFVTANGNELYVNSDTVLYSSPTHEIDIEIADIMHRYSERAKSADDKELDFLPREGALKAAVALLDKLQVFGEPDIRYFTAMTHDEIAAYQTELMEDARYAEFVELGKTKLLDSLTEAEDSYYLRFSFSNQGIPIFDREYEQPLKSASEDFYNRSLGAELLITAGGIRCFTMSGTFTADGKIRKAEKVISADEAMNLFADKYELQIVSDPIVITKVYLEYLPVKQNHSSGEVAFTPYWCLEYSLAGRGDSPRLAGAERFNAITGKDYAYGG
jgi:hypothetical protein